MASYSDFEQFCWWYKFLSRVSHLHNCTVWFSAYTPDSTEPDMQYFCVQFHAHTHTILCSAIHTNNITYSKYRAIWRSIPGSYRRHFSTKCKSQFPPTTSNADTFINIAACYWTLSSSRKKAPVLCRQPLLKSKSGWKKAKVPEKQKWPTAIWPKRQPKSKSDWKAKMAEK